MYCPQGGAEAIEEQSYLQSCIMYCNKGITHYIRAYQGELKVMQDAFGLFFFPKLSDKYCPYSKKACVRYIIVEGYSDSTSHSSNSTFL